MDSNNKEDKQDDAGLSSSSVSSTEEETIASTGRNKDDTEIKKEVTEKSSKLSWRQRRAIMQRANDDDEEEEEGADCFVSGIDHEQIHERSSNREDNRSKLPWRQRRHQNGNIQGQDMEDETIEGGVGLEDGVRPGVNFVPGFETRQRNPSNVAQGFVTDIENPTGGANGVPPEAAVTMVPVSTDGNDHIITAETVKEAEIVDPQTIRRRKIRIFLVVAMLVIVLLISVAVPLTVIEPPTAAPTEQPSEMPSESPSQINNLCSGAWFIDTVDIGNDTVVVDDATALIVGRDNDSDENTNGGADTSKCVSSATLNANDQLDDGTSTSTSVWYTFVGTGAIVEASLCPPLNTNNVTSQSSSMKKGHQLHVFSGSCDELKCIEPYQGKESISKNSTKPLCGGMTFDTTYGVEYFLRVSIDGLPKSEDNVEFNIISSPFTMSLSSNHDTCVGALGPLPFGETYDGTTSGTNIVTVPLCLQSGDGQNDNTSINNTVTMGEARGVWFSVVGTGGLLQATTCTHGTDFLADLDSVISVYEGDCNNNLSCVTVNDDWESPAYSSGFCGFLSLVVWESRKDQVYQILVHGYDTDDDDTFEFHLSIQNYNDECMSAIGPLQVDEFHVGTVEYATPDNIPSCGEATNSSKPGIWYYTVGTGGWMKASTCTTYNFLNGDYDSQITILTGGCDGGRGDDDPKNNDEDWMCIAGDDVGTNDCGTEAEVVWESVEGQVYYILVHGGDTQYPDKHGFALELSNAVNDRCEIAFTVHANIESVPYTTEGIARAPNPPIRNCSHNNSGIEFLPESSAPALWFHIVGTGDNVFVQASTAGSGTNDVYVIIQRGSCDALQCVTAGLFGQTFPTVDGEDYYIAVRGRATQTVPFLLTIHGIGTNPAENNGTDTFPTFPPWHFEDPSTETNTTTTVTTTNSTTTSTP